MTYMLALSANSWFAYGALNAPSSERVSGVNGTLFEAKLVGPFAEKLGFSKGMNSISSENSQVVFVEKLVPSDARRDSIFEYVPGDIKKSGPFCDGQRLAVMFNDNIRRLVVALLLLCGPSAICWPSVFNALRTLSAGIVPIIVFAVSRMFRRRSRPHVSRESACIIPPSSAHGDASSAVPWISRAVFQKASGLDVVPNAKNRVFFVPFGKSVCGRYLGKIFAKKTSARLRVAVSQRNDTDRFFGATVAFAQKLTGEASARENLRLDFLKHDKPSKPLADHVNFVRHAIRSFTALVCRLGVPSTEPPSYPAPHELSTRGSAAC